ncbi:hypothetical protein L7F22_037829 [Adiantum nelumboides]|nr:hypothetical protein [Adiantum nelumboides]
MLCMLWIFGLLQTRVTQINMTFVYKIRIDHSLCLSDHAPVRSREKLIVDKGCSSEEFFKSLHASRQRQSISRIKMSDGSWTSTKLQLSHGCVQHYATLFVVPASLSSLQSCARFQFLEVVSSIMDSDEVDALEQLFTQDELYHALRALGKWKAPGWDGLTAKFFHAFWGELKDVSLFMINSAWQEQKLPSLWKHGLLRLLPKKQLAESFDDWRPITLMPVIYKLVTKLLVLRVRDILHRGLHPRQYVFIPRRHIINNIANASIAIEYAKYTSQDVILLQVDIAKAFDSVHWDFISQIMSRLNFGPKWLNAIYWLYSDASTRTIIVDGLSDTWGLGQSVRQGCPLSALFCAISTHPLFLYIDKMLDAGLLHGLEIAGKPSFLAQAYADDSFFMPKNHQEDLRTLMKILSDFGLAAGLTINIKKSTLLPLKSCDWHSLFMAWTVIISSGCGTSSWLPDWLVYYLKATNGMGDY